MDPIVLPANQPAERPYAGGALIAEFRGVPDAGDRVPEDWVASTTTIAGHDTIGLTRLPDGRLLRDAIAADPVSWLGAEHVEHFGADTRLLVKLLHAGQRLFVHVHPDAAFAHEHLGRAHGKAEAWVILAGGDVYLGLTEDLPRPRLRELVDAQDAEGMLSVLHRRRVEPGDTVYVPAGTPHAIGPGVMLAEVQEPEDLSILLEWRGFDIDGPADGHLGLGFDTALQAVDASGRSAEEISRLITSGRHSASILAPASEKHFRAGRHVVGGTETLVPGYGVLIVTDGQMRAESERDSPLELDRGTTVVAPHSAGALTVSGHGELLALRPPAA